VKRVYTITVFDEELTIKTDADEKRIQEIAEYLQQKYDAVKAAAAHSHWSQQMALTILDVANDYFDMKDHVEDKSSQIILHIDSIAQMEV